jgi:hypothetical protein
MPKFLVVNLTERTVRLGIEPWAGLQVLAPKARVEFDYDEPAEIVFALDGDGGASVLIMSDRVRVSGNGEEKIFRPPQSYR